MDVYKLAIERIHFWPSFSTIAFFVPMLQRGNAYNMGSYAGAWEPGKFPVSNFKFPVSIRERLQNL